MTPSRVPPTVTVGDCVGSRRRSRAIVAFARPKSSTLTTPSGVILMLAGFRSRWTMPFSCAASSASAICRAMRERLVDRQAGAVRAIRSASVSPSTSSSTSARIAVAVFDAVDRADVRMIERGEQPRFALEAREPSGSRRERARQDLDRDVAAELRVARAIDLAHAARADAA